VNSSARQPTGCCPEERGRFRDYLVRADLLVFVPATQPPIGNE